MENLLLDENYKFLYETLYDHTQPQPTQIVTMMTRFRKNLSFSWISKIVVTKEKKADPAHVIASIIRTILQYTVHSDATVRVTAYSTLGGLLISITPFSAISFPGAFGEAIKDLEITPKLSIAIINMFMYLTRFTSPVFLEKYIIDVPVSFHFGVDVSEFIQFIPQTIKLMKDLPLELLRNILRSLICSCGRKPNAAFTSTIISLVELNFQPQMDVLMNYIQANDLDSAAVWLGPALLKDREVYNRLSPENRKLFFDYALKEFNRKPLNLCQFEHACKTCALFFRYTKGTPAYEVIKNSVMSALRNDYPPVYKVRMLFLPTPLEELTDNPNDGDSLRSARLNALATHFEDNLETADPDKIAEMFVSYQNSDNDLYCTFVDSFSRCIAEMIRHCKGETHLKLLEFILKKKNKNWVHDEAVAHLIDSIETTPCVKVFPQFIDLALDRLLDFELSSNDRLVETSLESIKKFASYDILDNLINRIIRSDWHDEAVVARRFLLLNELALLFKTKLFSMFIRIGYESLFLFENITTLSHIFAFLSNIEIRNVPQEIITFSLRFIVTHYEIYTRKELDKIGFNIPVPDKYFLDTLDTDIVTNPTINHQDALMHMKNCYSFLLSHKPTEKNDIRSLFTISMHLVPIFDSFALSGAASLADDNREYEKMMFMLATETFKTTSNDEVAAECCKYFVKSNQKLPDIVMRSVANYLCDEGTKNPDLLFLCYILTDQSDHDLAMEHLPILKQRLPPKEATILLFKLTNVVSRLAINQFPDKYSIALLEYALSLGGEYQQKVQNYIETVSFTEWPLDDEEMNACILKFIKEYIKVKINIENMSELDEIHLRFVISHIELFDEKPILQYIQDNRDVFAKIDISHTVLQPEPIFLLPLNETHTLKIASVAPLMDEGIFVNSPSLVKSYFTFSKQKISETLFETYVENFKQTKNEEALAILLEYALRVNLNVKSFDNDIFFMDSTFQLTLRHLAKLHVPIQSLDSQIIERIENKLGKKIIPELILVENDLTIQSIIRIDPNYFIDYVLNQEIYKAHDFIPLFHLLNNIPFDSQKLIALSNKYTPQYPSFTSIRKKTVYLRFLSCALFCLRAQQKTDEIQKIVESINSIFDKLLSSVFATMYKELSILFDFLVRNSMNTQSYTKFFSSLKCKTNEIYPMFIKHAAVLAVKKREGQICLSSSQLKHLTRFVLPSERNSVYLALQMFVSDVSSVDFFHYIKPYLINIQNELNYIANNFLTGTSFALFMMRLLTSPLSDNVTTDFYFSFAKAFLGNSKRPVFYNTLPLSPELNTKCQQLFDLLLSTQYSCTPLIKAIERIYAMSRLKMNKQARELFDVQVLERFLPLFEKYPTIAAGKLLYQIGRNSTDPASFFFMKLVLNTSNFLDLFVVLNTIFESMDDKFKQQVKTIVSATSYKPKSRALSMKRFIENTDKSLDFILAAADTNDVENLSKEYAELKNLLIF
ncbi:hypothetical protein TRFO_07152 [Tritrichomonas foetus]|uniref:Uncharacterized protein n=1 Tax=Tritrichomonas foetus TaxID=1144522 RepID=A0A1J4JT76_9EUKA|nr:hypothetical protein TRFO_07152 [Tritrichomonas foetus]|eukprot:OHT02329.1 hypothetical protein TRFO_07152 [Tritrichomonas foetus]